MHKRVFNTAIPGGFELYDNLLRYAEDLGGQFDDVVIAVCMENDLSLYGASGQADPDTTNNAAALRPTQVPRRVVALKAIKSWLRHNSAAYIMFTAAAHESPWIKNLAVRANLLVPNLVAIETNVHSEELIERSANRLAEIARRYKYAVILIIPSRALWVGNNRSVEDRVHREFITALAARHLNVVDMRDIFESEGDVTAMPSTSALWRLSALPLTKWQPRFAIFNEPR